MDGKVAFRLWDGPFSDIFYNKRLTKETIIKLILERTLLKPYNLFSEQNLSALIRVDSVMRAIIMDYGFNPSPKKHRSVYLAMIAANFAEKRRLPEQTDDHQSDSIRLEPEMS